MAPSLFCCTNSAADQEYEPQIDEARASGTKANAASAAAGNVGMNPVIK